MSEPHRPLFSFVIPAFMAGATLRRAADSVRAQSEPDWEAVVVDDGSSDGTAETVREIARTDPRFRLVSHPENRGTHAARRTGVAAARGEWILFLDPDDEFAPGALARLRNRIESSPVDLVHFDFAFRSPDSVPPGLREYHERRRCTGRASVGPGCALKTLFSAVGSSVQIWTFLCRGEVCREAFARTEDARLVYAEDYYEVFAMASLAESYAEEPFVGCLYETASGGITDWRGACGKDADAYVRGFLGSLEGRVASFAAMARYARRFRGKPAARSAVRRAMLRERRRLLAGTLPWEFSVVASQGLSFREVLRRAIPRLHPMSFPDRAAVRFFSLLRVVLERLRILPSPARTARVGRALRTR